MKTQLTTTHTHTHTHNVIRKHPPTRVALLPRSSLILYRLPLHREWVVRPSLTAAHAFVNAAKAVLVYLFLPPPLHVTGNSVYTRTTCIYICIICVHIHERKTSHAHHTLAFSLLSKRFSRRRLLRMQQYLYCIISLAEVWVYIGSTS